MATKMKGYKLDLAHQTLTLTAAFADAANNPGSAEYKLVRQFLHDFPNLEIVNRTRTSPTSYKGKGQDGKRTSYYPTKNLSYERMERFMNALDNSQKYLDEYHKLREKAEAICLSPYAPVAQWFMAQFPKFREEPLFYLDTEKLPDVISFSDYLENANKKTA